VLVHRDGSAGIDRNAVVGEDTAIVCSSSSVG